MTEKNLILANLQVHTEKSHLQNAYLVVRDGIIQAIEPINKFEKKSFTEIYEFPHSYHLVPGFIDMHVHGANGSDVMDATPEALMNISQTLAKEGTTSFLATTMTAELDHIEKTLKNVRDFMNAQHDLLGARILGVHLEGPFIAEKKANAQRADGILPPKNEYIQRWQKISDDAIKLVTLAPELSDCVEFIKYLRKQNIIASMGHTNATYSESVAAIDAGCTHATHLFNAMRGIHQREPGVVTAALLSDQVMAELIVDGVHLHPAIVELALKLKGKDKITLVTDAMRAKCLADGTYDLGGQMVEVKDQIAQLANGTLAGSVLKMNSALKNLLKFTRCSLADAITMAAENPAKSLGIFANKGSVALGKDADLVVLDDEFNVVMTVCGGVVVYRN